MITFLFPGQGSQRPGMNEELEKYMDLKGYYERGKKIIGFDIRKIMNAPQKIMNLTMYTQTLNFFASHIAYEVLKKKGIKPNYVAGHSLGEYSALTAANFFSSYNSALRLVERRAIYMSKKVIGEDENPMGKETYRRSLEKIAKTVSLSLPNENSEYKKIEGGMGVVLGKNIDKDYLKEMTKLSHVYVANENTPNQIAVSGKKGALERLKN